MGTTSEPGTDRQASTRAHVEASGSFDSPLILSSDAVEHSSAAPLLTFLLVLMLAVGSFMLTRNANEKQQQIVLVQRTADAVTAIDRRMSAYIDLLYGVGGILGRNGGVDHAEFAEFVQSLDIAGRYQGVQVIGAAKVIDRDDIDRVVREIDADAASSGLGYPTFTVQAPTDEMALPIAYIEPTDSNVRSFGFDLWSEPVRRVTAERARDTGDPAATSPVRLIQETGDQLGFLVMLPTYQHHVPLDTVGQRRAAFTGVAYAAFRMGDLMEGVSGPSDTFAALEVYDHTQSAANFADSLTFATHPEALAAPDLPRDAPQFGMVEVAGRTWQIYFDAGVPALSTTERSLPALMLLGGLLVALLLSLLVRSVLSARTRAQRLAMEMSGELKALTSAAREGIISVDQQGLVVSWNRGAAEMFGYEPSDTLGSPFVDLMPANRRDKYLAAFTELAMHTPGEQLPGGHVLNGTMEITGLHAGGTEFPIELSVTTWQSGSNQYATGFMRDVTERHALARSQHDALELERDVVAKLRELDVAKSEFVSTMSHELRTPLTSILGFTEMLIDREESVEPSALRMLEIVERNAQRLLLLVEDLLTLSQIESGGFEIKRSSFDPRIVIDAVLSAIEPMASSKQLELDVFIDGPDQVMADRVQFERVVLNLLNNAVKFTPAGGTVSIASRQLGSDSVITVADTGIGIPAGEIDQLFSRFFRSTTATEHAIQGTGLGLAIVQNIVRQHGGSISVDSTEGEGTTFTVRLPIETMPDPATGDHTGTDAVAAVRSRRPDPLIAQEAMS